ncbi:MAG: hypothetical protein AB1486_20775 [Planctomycetota bacterium]
MTGQTGSPDFPTTPGAYDTSYNGGSWDGFLAKLSTSGSSLLYATFLGGAESEGVGAVAFDGSGRAVVAGWTASSDFPTTPGAYDTSYNGGTYDAFVVELVPSALGCETDAVWWNYGLGWPGTHGVPCLIATNLPIVCRPLSLIICNSLGTSTTAFFFLGLSPADLPTP